MIDIRLGSTYNKSSSAQKFHCFGGVREGLCVHRRWMIRCLCICLHWAFDDMPVYCPGAVYRACDRKIARSNPGNRGTVGLLRGIKTQESRDACARNDSGHTLRPRPEMAWADMLLHQCQSWHQSPAKNPLTHQHLQYSRELQPSVSPVYGDLASECASVRTSGL